MRHLEKNVKARCSDFLLYAQRCKLQISIAARLHVHVRVAAELGALCTVNCLDPLGIGLHAPRFQYKTALRIFLAAILAREIDFTWNSHARSIQLYMRAC